MIKILSGKYRNLPIYSCSNDKNTKHIRPTKSLVREAMFNILEHSSELPVNFISDAVVLDICCGIGSLGFEAISRGAKHVTFIDNNKLSLDLVSRTAMNIKCLDDVSVRYLNALKIKANLKLQHKVNLVFFDPPYESKLIKILLPRFLNQENFSKDTVFVIEEKYKKFPELPSGYRMIDRRKYGCSEIIFLAYDNS